MLWLPCAPAAAALAAVPFEEPEAETVARCLEGARLVAPILLGFELANVCLIKARRHPEQRAELISAFRLWRRLGIERIAIDYESTLQLALTTGLAATEASYLWLARRLDATLITLDRQLAQAHAAL